MNAPFNDKSGNGKPRRPARSIRELRRRKRGTSYQSPLARILYAILNGLLYALGGVFIDVIIALVRAMMGIGSGDIFWLFAPFMLVLGALIGFIDGKDSGADSMDMITSGEAGVSQIDDNSIRHDIFKGIGKGILIFAIIWFIMMIMT